MVILGFMNKKTIMAMTIAATTSLGLVACGDSQEPQQATATAEASETATSAEATTSDDTTSNEPTSEAQTTVEDPIATGEDPVFAVIDVVSRHHPQSVIVDIDREDNEDNTEHYEVDVVSRSVIELDVVVSGGQVIELDRRATTGDVMEDEREGDDGDVAKAHNINVSALDAVVQALDQHPEGVIDEVKLDDEDGRLVWEIDLDDQNGNDLAETVIEAN